MPEAAEEQLPGALPVCVPVEPKAEVGNVQVDGEGDDGEGPRGDVQGGGRGGHGDQGQAVAQGDAPAQVRVGDRHHAVAAPGVVFAEAPAQRVEMRKLPGVEDSSQKTRSCTEVWGSKTRRHQRSTEAPFPTAAGPGGALPPRKPDSLGSSRVCASLSARRWRWAGAGGFPQG